MTSEASALTLLSVDQLYSWLRHSQDTQSHPLNQALAQLPTDRQDAVLRAVAELMAEREHASLRLVDALQWELRQHTHRPSLVTFAKSELEFFAWMRGSFRQHPMMSSGLLDKFLNRLPDQSLTRLVEEPHKHDVEISHRVWEVGGWLETEWDPSKGTALIDWLLSNTRGQILGSYTQHFVVLFMEAFRDGVIPGTALRRGALDVRVRAQRWGWFFSHPVSTSL